jgi:hypothetical protein
MIRENHTGQAGTLTEALLVRKLGRLQDYPEALIEKARHTYALFLKAYLDTTRIKGADESPLQADTFRIDKSVVDEMRHFFSDYQHITREFIRVEGLLSRLAQTDREKEPHLYRQILDEIRSPGCESELMKGVIQ